jgi:N-acetylated-alpha-linked acidic dipeptidase
LRAIPDAAHAESNLRHITSEPHLAGTEGSHRLAEWLRDQYRSYGFDAEIVSYSVWLPQVREVKLELTTPKTITLGTPEQPIEIDKDTYNKDAVGRRDGTSDLCELWDAGRLSSAGSNGHKR